MFPEQIRQFGAYALLRRLTLLMQPPLGFLDPVEHKPTTRMTDRIPRPIEIIVRVVSHSEAVRFPRRRDRRARVAFVASSERSLGTRFGCADAGGRRGLVRHGALHRLRDGLLL